VVRSKVKKRVTDARVPDPRAWLRRTHASRAHRLLVSGPPNGNLHTLYRSTSTLLIAWKLPSPSLLLQQRSFANILHHLHLRDRTGTSSGRASFDSTPWTTTQTVLGHTPWTPRSETERRWTTFCAASERLASTKPAIRAGNEKSSVIKLFLARHVSVSLRPIV
jgi:hypothetical protein